MSSTYGAHWAWAAMTESTFSNKDLKNADLDELNACRRMFHSRNCIPISVRTDSLPFLDKNTPGNNPKLKIPSCHSWKQRLSKYSMVVVLTAFGNIVIGRLVSIKGRRRLFGFRTTNEKFANFQNKILVILLTLGKNAKKGSSIVLLSVRLIVVGRCWPCAGFSWFVVILFLNFLWVLKSRPAKTRSLSKKTPFTHLSRWCRHETLLCNTCLESWLSFQFQRTI